MSIDIEHEDSLDSALSGQSQEERVQRGGHLMDNDIEREAFEKAMQGRAEFHWLHHADQYGSLITQRMWATWKAARAQPEHPSARVAAFDAVNRRFVSGNNTPVESARITREEFMEIAGVIEDAKREAMRAQAGEAIANKYNDCACGDLMASGEFVCDNCMSGYKAGILPSGHVIISADEYDFLRKQIATEKSRVSELRLLAERLQHCAQGFYVDQGDYGHMEAIMQDYHAIMRGDATHPTDPGQGGES